MSWVRIDDDIKVEAGRSRFLIDENVDVEVAGYLRKRGFNVKTIAEAGLRHRDDKDVMALAWREDRILLTHDDDFLDETRFPPSRNPGTVVLPGGTGGTEALAMAIVMVVAVVGTTRDIWRGANVRISSDGTISVRFRDYESGARITSLLRYDGRHAYEWVEDD